MSVADRTIFEVTGGELSTENVKRRHPQGFFIGLLIDLLIRIRLKRNPTSPP
jgi:hypothetical protein